MKEGVRGRGDVTLRGCFPQFLCVGAVIGVVHAYSA